MNREEISLQIPAFLSIPEQSEFNSKYKNEFVTHARLKIFYIGETLDNRLFTEKFAKKLMKTLPQTPIVAFFDEKGNDFKGHNSTQYVYGYVPENASYSIDEDDDGSKWAFVDVVLFTGREDNIGEVAAKIVGKQQSLEIDPNSFDYIVNRDGNGKFKNIEFTEGKLIGLSVLGDDEQPAFDGSTFFKKQEKEDLNDLIAKYKNIKTLDLSCFSVQTNENNNGGVEEMDLENFSQTTLVELNNFMKKTYSELQQEVYESALKRFKDIYIVQLGEDTVVFYNYNSGKYERASYTKKEDGYEFSDSVEVKNRYLTDEEIEATFTVENAELDVFNVIGMVQENEVKIMQMPQSLNVVQTTFGSGEFNQFGTGDFNYFRYIPQTAPELGQWGTFELNREILGLGQGESNEGQEGEKRIFLTQSEKDQIDADRAELESFRRGRKEELIAKHSEFLTEEEVADFTARIAEFTIETLEKELSLKSMQAVFKNNIQFKNGKSVTVFTAPQSETPKNTTEEINSMIDQYK